MAARLAPPSPASPTGLDRYHSKRQRLDRLLERLKPHLPTINNNTVEESFNTMYPTPEEPRLSLKKREHEINSNFNLQAYLYALDRPGPLLPPQEELPLDLSTKSDHGRRQSFASSEVSEESGWSSVGQGVAHGLRLSLPKDQQSTPSRSPTSTNPSPDHRTPAVTYPCLLCGQVFKFHGRLERHIALRHQLHQLSDESWFPVGQSLAPQFLSLPTSPSPVQEQIVNDASAPYTCEICGEKFRFSDRLAKHVASRHRTTRSQESTRAYRCSFDSCNRSFSRSDMLTRHARLHTGIKPYSCGICSQVFTRSDHLATHQRTHTGEKPYKCSVCPYAACRRDMITRHMRTHSRQAPPQAACTVSSPTNI